MSDTNELMRAMASALKGLMSIVSDSDGVAGYEPGRVAIWDEFPEIDAAHAVLTVMNDDELHTEDWRAALRPFVVYTPEECFEGSKRFSLIETTEAGGGWFGSEDFRRAKEALAAPETAAHRPELLTAAHQMVSDYQTSEHHHPNHVLVPLAAFKAMQDAITADGTPDRDGFYGPYTVTWIGPCVWAGIKEELPPTLIDKKVWLTASTPAATGGNHE